MHKRSANRHVKPLPPETSNQPNTTPAKKATGVLHSAGKGYWVSNEGTKNKPLYHVWMPDVYHSVCDSAYTDLETAIRRCNFIAHNEY